MNDIQVMEGNGERPPWIPTESEKADMAKDIIAKMQEEIQAKIEQAKEAGLQKILDDAKKDQERLDAFTKDTSNRIDIDRAFIKAKMDELHGLLKDVLQKTNEVLPAPANHPFTSDPMMQTRLMNLEEAIKDIVKCFYALNNEIMIREQAIRNRGVYDQEVIKNLLANEIGQIVMQKWPGISAKIASASNKVCVSSEY